MSCDQKLEALAMVDQKLRQKVDRIYPQWILVLIDDVYKGKKMLYLYLASFFLLASE